MALSPNVTAGGSSGEAEARGPRVTRRLSADKLVTGCSRLDDDTFESLGRPDLPVDGEILAEVISAAPSVRPAMEQESMEQRPAPGSSQHRYVGPGLAPLPTPDESLPRFLINNQSEDGTPQPPVYINAHLRHVLKDHQIEGVRFMWRRIVEEGKGGVLAHSMGLGKTLQVITVLSAIAEACSHANNNPGSQFQVPKHLRTVRYVVLCPTSVVDVWCSQLSQWTPPRPLAGGSCGNAAVGILGATYPLTASLKKAERKEMIESWAGGEGILVVGYKMFRAFCSDGDNKALANLILREANAVVADEAHEFGKHETELLKLISKFTTRSRITMTGTPVTNTLIEYHSILSWQAAGRFLDHAEYKKVLRSTKKGFYKDSSAENDKRAKADMKSLMDYLDVVTHRAVLDDLAPGSLPEKKEFVLFVSLTGPQLAAYREYGRLVLGQPGPRAKSSSTGRNKENERPSHVRVPTWASVSYLGSLLAHPSIYHERLAGGTQPAPDGAPNFAGLPQKIFAQLLQPLQGHLTDPDESNKIVLLNRILDQCAKVKDKVLVFSQRLPVLDYLGSMFTADGRRYYRLDGQTSHRQALVNQFNAELLPAVFLISTTAGGVGLNIQGANRVVIFDFGYTPTQEQQAIARSWRLGQEKPVFVYWLLTATSFELSVHNRSVYKRQLAARVIDKKEPDPWARRGVELFGDVSIPEPAADLQQFVGQDSVLDSIFTCPQNGELVSVMSTDEFEVGRRGRDGEALDAVEVLSISSDTDEGEVSGSKGRPLKIESDTDDDEGEVSGSKGRPLEIKSDTDDDVDEMPGSTGGVRAGTGTAVRSGEAAGGDSDVKMEDAIIVID